MQALHHLAQLLGNALGLVWWAAFQQHAKLVAPQPGQGVTFAQSGLQHGADVPQQFVARGMAAGVVHQLELVEVKEHQRMPPGLARQAVQGLFQAVLELTAVGQAGQGVMGGLPGQVGDVLALLGHVMQHQNDATELAVTDDRRAHQVDRHGAAVQPLDQPGMLGAALEAAAQHLLDQAAAIFLGLLVHQAEQRRQRQALGLA